MTSWDSYTDGDSGDPVAKWREDMHALVDATAEHVRALKDREQRERIAARPDSFPRQSMGGGGRATNELDEDGTPVPQHSDPVAQAVIARDESTEVLGPVISRLVARAMRTALGELNYGNNLALKALAPPKDEKRSRPENDDIWCVSHLRFDMTEPYTKQRSKLCDLCHEWQRDPMTPGDLPCREILDRVARGSNLTTALITEVYAPGKKAKGRK